MTEDTVLLNLSIISQIQRGNKLNTTEDIIKIDNRYIQSLFRFVDGDGRNKTVEKITAIVNDTFKHIDNIFKSENTSTGRTSYFMDNNSQKLQQFKYNMENAGKGLENLKETYCYDITICSSIQQLIRKLKGRIIKIEKVLTIKNKDTSEM